MSCLSVCFAIAPVKQKRALFAKKLKVAYFQCFRVVICIENPRVPGSIPGRGTTYQEALIRNGRGFFALTVCSVSDASDSKSAAREGVPVQVRPQVPFFAR